MKWLWIYIRRKMKEALLAGVHDAMSGNAGPSLTDEQAAKALQAIIENSGVTTELGDGSSPPALAAPDESGTLALPEQPKRGPGRPRKFQEPPV
jgi:hypothetical protein